MSDKILRFFFFQKTSANLFFPFSLLTLLTLNSSHEIDATIKFYYEI